MARARIPVAETLTNIGTTVPRARALTQPAPRFVPGSRALPVALPVDDGSGRQYVTPDPLWISRWQPSATRPLSKAPWVTGYRWWLKGSVYQSLGKIDYYRIDLKWRDHAHAYIVPDALFFEFRGLRSSVGQWFHRTLLGPGWKPGAGSVYPNFAI